ncbi:hypothetical protein NMYAN_40065 [Nitrosomonas nitrosa]|uniref:Uncharacterized protein n=1 Tax=Nitrosomonas nitrosa TaxID=52442 RepID=A0A8H8Z0S3_9PROT|nr:hypothetical protein NMYAN_40065 [Nitrosomonas nitrosa]
MNIRSSKPEEFHLQLLTDSVRVFIGAETIILGTLMRFYERFSSYKLHLEALMPVYGLVECSVELSFPSIGRGPLISFLCASAQKRYWIRCIFVMYLTKVCENNHITYQIPVWHVEAYCGVV